jgi:hypothetical protein
MLTGLSAMKSDNFILKAIFGPVLEVLLFAMARRTLHCKSLKFKIYPSAGQQPVQGDNACPVCRIRRTRW